MHQNVCYSTRVFGSNRSSKMTKIMINSEKVSCQQSTNYMPFTTTSKQKSYIHATNRNLKSKPTKSTFQSLHWTSKVNDHLGRFQLDCSNRTSGYNLNSEESLQLPQEIYGDMSLSSIHSCE